MASAIWDSGQTHRRIGEELNNFLYKDGHPNKGVVKHSYEELWNMLENIRLQSWSEYDDVAREMGWK
jgi:hypothetical protein